MYGQRVNHVIVGGFVAAMLLGLGVALALLTGRTGAVDRYALVLDNVADVKYGTQVRYEGYPVGQVEAIAPLREDGQLRFRLELSVERGWRIPRDSVGRIGSTTFLGAKTIDIAGGESVEILEPGAEIAGAPPADLFAAVSGAAGRLSALTEGQIEPLLASLGVLAQTVEEATPQIAGELVAFSRRLNETLVPLRRALDDETLAAVRRTLGNAETASANFVAIGDELRESLATVDTLTRRIDALIAANEGRVDQSLEDARYTLATIARSIDSLVHNLDGTGRNMHEFSRQLRRNPGLLLNSPAPEAAAAPEPNRPAIGARPEQARR